MFLDLPVNFLLPVKFCDVELLLLSLMVTLKKLMCKMIYNNRYE